MNYTSFVYNHLMNLILQYKFLSSLILYNGEKNIRGCIFVIILTNKVSFTME